MLMVSGCDGNIGARLHIARDSFSHVGPWEFVEPWELAVWVCFSLAQTYLERKFCEGTLSYAH